MGVKNGAVLGMNDLTAHKAAARAAPHPQRLPQAAFDFLEPVGAFEDFAGFAAVGRADDAVAVHHVEDAGGAAVAEAEAALQR